MKENKLQNNKMFLTPWLMFISEGFTNIFWVLTWESNTWPESIPFLRLGPFPHITAWTIWLLHSKSDSGQSLFLALILTEHMDNSFHTDGSVVEMGFDFIVYLVISTGWQYSGQVAADRESGILFPYWYVLFLNVLVSTPLL